MTVWGYNLSSVMPKLGCKLVKRVRGPSQEGMFTSNFKVHDY